MQQKQLILRLSAFLVLSVVTLTAWCGAPGETDAINNTDKAVLQPARVYQQLHLKEAGLSEKAFQLAVKGWEKLKLTGQVTGNIISICDYSQSCNNKRFYVIDIAACRLLFNTLVAHGKNTGEEFAKYFSNNPSSLQSSLGFYVTGNSYIGTHGLGLRLEGKEPGFNDKANARDIVMHGASYVCQQFIDQYGKLGRSWGCPALPFDITEQVINTIKDGTCLFVYYPDKGYLSASKLVR